MFKSFCRHGKPIPKDDIRSMVRALKKNEAVWFAPDQSYRNKGAAMVNFFGIPAASNPATSRLARISGAAVMTYFGERLPGNAGYRVVIGPAFENFPGADPVRRCRTLQSAAGGTGSPGAGAVFLGASALQGIEQRLS